MSNRAGDKGRRSEARHDDHDPGELAPGRRTITGQLGSKTRSKPPQAVGRRALTDRLAIPGSAPAVQRKAAPDEVPSSAGAVREAAAQGAEGASGAFPYRDVIQRAFGRHALGDARAQVGGGPGATSRAIGAQAYTYGDRVVFAAAPDLHTAAHEAAHVVQQRGGVQVDGGVGQTGDVHERHADAVADAVVAGQSAEPLLDQTSGGGGAPVVQRKAEAERFVASSGDRDGGWFATTAQGWVHKWDAMLVPRLEAYLTATSFVMPTPFADWSSGASAAFAKQVWAPIAALPTGSGQVYSALQRILTPDQLDPLVNAGRDAPIAVKTDLDYGRIDPKGSGMWADAVVSEVGKFLVKRIIESLARVMPRWLAARNQLALSSEGPAKTQDRDPKQGEVVASHPIDPYVIGALAGHVTANLKAYRLSHPEQNTLGDMQLGRLQKVQYQWLHDQGAWNWIRVTSPPNATREDVANTLYADSTYAHTITDAAPLFGITDIEHLSDAPRTEYEKHAQTAKSPPRPGDDPDIADPEQQMQAWGVLPEEVMLAEASKIKPTGIRADESGRKAIVDRMNAGLQLFQQIFQVSETMPAGGYRSLLDSAYGRLQKRAFKVADTATPMAQIVPYDGQTQGQNELLAKALAGITVAVKQYATFSKWPNSGAVVQQVGWLYLKVACLSEQYNAGEEALAGADEQSKLFPVTVMELLLAEIRKVLHAESGSKLDKKLESDADHDQARDVAEHTQREAKLREGLARVRDKLLQNQDGADADLKELTKELIDLENEVAIVADLDAMDQAWQALYNDLSVVGVFTGANSDDTEKMSGKAGVLQFKIEWDRIYTRYRSGDKAGAIQELQAKRPGWVKLYNDIGKLIEHNETKNKWVTFGILIGIAVITAGVGAYVEGAAGAAWGASSWATFTVTTGAEAASFTSMSYLLVERDPTIGGFFLELVKNFAMFGALKGLTGKYIELVGKENVGTIDTMAAQFVALNTAALVEADAKKYLATGQHLSMDEVLEISKENAIFMIASGIATMAAKPGLEALKLHGEADGALARVRGLKTELRSLTTELQSSRNVDEARAQDVLGKQRELLVAEEDALQRLEKIASDPKTAKKAGIDAKIKTELQEARKAHDDTVKAVKAAKVMSETEGAGPVRWAAKGAVFDEVRDWWKAQDGAKVTELVTDKQFGARGVEITTKDGETFRLLERTSENPDLIANSPQLRRAAPTPEQVAANRADAEKAAQLMEQQTASLAKLIDAMPVAEFERLQVGGDAAGLYNQASLPASAGGGGAPGAVSKPSVLTISDKIEVWRNRGPVNQMPGEVEGPGLDAAATSDSQHDYVSPTALADAIARGRYQSGMALYRGHATGEIEEHAGQPDWQSSKRLRIKIVTEKGARYFYADNIDLATGPGTSKLVDDRFVVGGKSGKGYQEMTQDGRITYGDRSPTAIRPGAKRVLVWGGAGNAAATAEEFAKAGCDVVWAARISAKGVNPTLKPEYDAIVAELKKNPPDELRKELEARKKTLEAFGYAMLPRNVAEAFDSPIAKEKIDRKIGSVDKIDSFVDKDGNKSVQVELNGQREVFDQLVISQGQDASGPDATMSLAGRFKLEMILDGNGRLVGLQSKSPPGAVRLMGAAFADRKMVDYVVEDQQGAFLRKLAEQSLALPDNSKGVAPSLANASRNITGANDILAARDFRLAGKTGTLVLPAGAEATWPGKVAVFLGGEIGIDPARLEVDMISDGRSGDPVFHVRVGAEELGYFKVFSQQDAAQELALIDKIRKAHLEHMKVVGSRGTAAVSEGSATGKTAVLMTTARGESVASMVEHLPIEPAPRAEALKHLEIAVEHVARGLGEMHGSFEDGLQSDAQKRSSADYIVDKLDDIKDRLGDAHYNRIKNVLETKVVPDYLRSKVPATAYHGDANLGNFVVDGQGDVTAIDVGKMKYSFDASGKAIGTGAADRGRFLESLAANPRLAPGEAQRLSDAFDRAYFHALRGKVTPADLEAATLLYRVELEVVKIASASPDAAKVADTSAVGATARLDALLGITDTFTPDVTPPSATSADDKKKSVLPPVLGAPPTVEPN